MIKHNKNTSIFLILIIIIFIVLGFFTISRKLKPIVMSVAEDESKNMATIICNDAVKKEIVEGVEFNKLFIITSDDNSISTIDLDTVILNRIQSNITNNIIYNLKKIEKGNIDELEMYNDTTLKESRNKLNKGIIYEVPISISYDNIFLSNLSPKVPVKFNLIGSVDSNIRTNVINYGINNAVIEVYINLKVSMRVIIPFNSNEIITEVTVPLAHKLVNGKVPQYFSSGNTNSNLSIPIE